MPTRSLPQPQRGGVSIRRILLPLLAVFIAAAVLIASSPVDAAPRKIKLGISMTEGTRNIDVFDEFTAKTGYRPAIWTVWSAWGNPDTRKFPSDMVAKIKARKATALVFWEPVTQQGVCTKWSKFRKIKSGQFDWYIKSWLRAAKRSKAKILLRFAHEINGRYFPWTIGSCGNTVKDYKAAWRRIMTFKKRMKANNVKAFWTVAKRSSSGGNPYKRFYPGDRYVDVVGFSSFNWGTADGKQWISMVQGVRPIMKWFRQFTRKPVIIAELATNHVGGDKPAWIRDGYRQVYAKYPQIKGIVYLNEDLTAVGHPDWSLDAPGPATISAYEWVLDYKKNGTYIFRGR